MCMSIDHHTFHILMALKITPTLTSYSYENASGQHTRPRKCIKPTLKSHFPIQPAMWPDLYIN